MIGCFNAVDAKCRGFRVVFGLCTVLIVVAGVRSIEHKLRLELISIRAERKINGDYTFMCDVMIFSTLGNGNREYLPGWTKKNVRVIIKFYAKVFVRARNRRKTAPKSDEKSGR